MDITKILLQNLRTHLQIHPIAFDIDSMIDFLFQHYSEFVLVFTETMLEKYKAVGLAVLELMKERNAARGVESHIVWDENEETPYNEDLEMVWIEKPGGGLAVL